MRDSVDWDKYNFRYVEPLLMPAREGLDPDKTYNIYTGRYWGGETEEEMEKREI